MNEAEELKELVPGDGEDPGEFEINRAEEMGESAVSPPETPDSGGEAASESIRESEQKAAPESIRPDERKAAPESVRGDERKAAPESVRESERKFADEKLLREAESFVREYPDVDVRDVPAEVWREVLSGRATLAEAWTKHENAALKREIAALKNRESARARTTGARKSSSGVSARDEFLSAFWE